MARAPARDFNPRTTIRRDGVTAMSSDIRSSPEEALRRGLPRRGAATTGDAVDTALIGQIAEGDRPALRVLYVRHHGRIRRFIQRLVGSAAVADELVHEVFLEVWRSAASFPVRARLHLAYRASQGDRGGALWDEHADRRWSCRTSRGFGRSCRCRCRGKEHGVCLRAGDRSPAGSSLTDGARQLTRRRVLQRSRCERRRR
jgi:hypothetical protein